MQNEILEDFGVKPAELGDNITTKRIDLLGLGRGTGIHLLPALLVEEDQGADGLQTDPFVRITGLRNPCPQIEKFKVGLQEKFNVRDEERQIVDRKASVMDVVGVGGDLEPGTRMEIEEPSQFEPLECV